MKKTDVFALIKEITNAEQDMNIKVTNKSVKHLMDLYQKAIEYYSALDNKCYEDFLNRMTGLFKREDVQIALSQPDEEAKVEDPEPESSSLTQDSNNSDEIVTSLNTDKSEDDALID